MLLNTIVNIFRISCIMFFLLLLGLPCYLEARIYLYNLLMCDVWRLIRYNHQKKRISWSCHIVGIAWVSQKYYTFKFYNQSTNNENKQYNLPII